MLHKHLDDLSRANPSVKFYRVDVDAMPQVCSKYAVAKLPTLVFFRRSIPVDRVEGLDVDRLNRTLKKHL